MKRTGCWALVPAKPFALAKTRLASRLGPQQRMELARELVVRTLSTLAEVTALDGVALLSRDPEAEPLARACGAHAVPERGRGNLANVIDAGLEELAGADAVVVVLADLPELLASDVADMLRLGERHSLVLAPDTRDEGTNCLFLQLPKPMPTCFGRYGSFLAHQRQAQRLGINLAVHRRPSLGFDLDTIADLERLASSPQTHLAALAAAGLYGDGLARP